MKKITILISLITASFCSNAQVNIIDESFTSFNPAWTTWGDYNWVHNPNSGKTSPGSSTAVIGDSFGATSGWFQSPWSNLTPYNTVQLEFDIALVAWNGGGLIVSVWYDTGAGWNRINDYSQNNGGLSASDFITGSGVMTSYDAPSQDYIKHILLDVSSLNIESNIRFSIGIENPAMGGDQKVFIDDFLLSGTTLRTGIESVQINSESLVIYNNNNGIHFDFNQFMDIEQIELYDITGKVVLSKFINENSRSFAVADQNIQNQSLIAKIKTKYGNVFTKKFVHINH